MKNKEYQFVIYDRDTVSDKVLFSATVNEIDGLISNQYLFTTLIELLVKIEIEGYTFAILKGSEDCAK